MGAVNQPSQPEPKPGGSPHRLAELRPGQRVSLRYRLPTGELTELVGLTLHSSGTELVVRDRNGQETQLPWDRVVAARRVGVPRGRDPRRTPVAELDRLAAVAGLTGQGYVARLSGLLGDREPPVPEPWDAAPPAPASLAGEWVSCGGLEESLALAWWASQHDARNIQVRTVDPAAAEQLLRLGFHAIS